VLYKSIIIIAIIIVYYGWNAINNLGIQWEVN